MLKTIYLENFKSHKDTTLELDESRLHAIVGKNGSGKTSILEAIYYLSLCSKNDDQAIYKDEKSPNFLVSSGQTKCMVKVSGSLPRASKTSLWWNIEQFFDLKETHRDSMSGREKAFTGWISIDLETFPIFQLINRNNEKLNPLILFLRNFVYVNLSTKKLSQAAYSEDITPTIKQDGSNLAPTLDYIRNEYPDQFKQIEEMLKQVVPNVQKIGIKRAKVMVTRQRSIEVNGQFIPYDEKQEFAGQEVVLDMQTGERIPAHAISEGTMLTLGLLTVLMNPKQPNLVLLDDIEQGLHPKAQRDLIAVFKQIIDKNPNLQIIFTTHSPYIIDELEPSQIHVLSNDQSGFTITQRLDEHPNIKWAIETLTTGEFWSAEGEEWVKKGDE